MLASLVARVSILVTSRDSEDEIYLESAFHRHSQLRSDCNVSEASVLCLHFIDTEIRNLYMSVLSGFILMFSYFFSPELSLPLMYLAGRHLPGKVL